MKTAAPGSLRRIAETALLAAAYVAGGWIGFLFAFGNESITAVWPPTGIAIAAFVILGRRAWLGVLLGALALNVLNGSPLYMAAGICIGNTLAPAIGGEILRRRGSVTFDRTRDVFTYLVVCAAAMTISATLGTAVVHLADAGAGNSFARNWLVWWAGDAMGAILVGPFLITMRLTALSRHVDRRIETIVTVGLAATFAIVLWHAPLPVNYLVLPVAVWAALRLGPLGAATTTIFIAAAVILSQAHTGTDDGLLMLHTLNVTVAITSLALAAMMSERRRAELELRAMTAELEELVSERTADLRASRERFAQAQRLAHIGSFYWTAATDTNNWSDELFAIYELDPEGGPPNMDTYMSFIDAEAREHVAEGVQNAIATGQPVGHEYPVVTNKGTHKWVHAYVAPVMNDDGTLLGLQGTCQDITTQREAEEARRNSEARFRALLASAPDAIIVVDHAGTIELINDATTNLLGYAVDELVGQPVDILLPDALRSTHAAYREGYLMDPRRRPMGSGRDLWAQHKDGSQVAVDVSLSPVQTPDGTVIFAAIRNATERRKAEESLRRGLKRERDAAERLRKLDEAKNAFLSAVSHELRTPLTAIVGFAELLEQTDVRDSTDMTADIVDRLAANARRLSGLLGDLLDIDRLQRGIVEPRRRRAVVRDLVDHALATVDPRGRRVTLDIDDCVVFVDVAQVERIIENLVTNAIKYTPEGSPIEIHVRSDDHGGLILVVDDEGPGIPDDVKLSIFEPFYRAGNDTFTQGTGIGLALVDRFAKLHGGQAWVDDRDPVGASFHVAIPGPSTDEHDGLAVA